MLSNETEITRIEPSLLKIFKLSNSEIHLCRTLPGGPELLTEILDLKKKSLRNFLVMFKVLQFLEF